MNIMRMGFDSSTYQWTWKRWQSTPVRYASPPELHGELCLQKESGDSESKASSRLGREKGSICENKIKIGSAVQNNPVNIMMLSSGTVVCLW